MDGLVRRLRKLLLAVSRTYGEDLNLVFDLQALHLKIQQENHEMGVLLRQCFLLFVVLTSTTPRSFSDPQYEDDSLFISPNYKKDRIRFHFLLLLLVYFQNRLATRQLEPFWFLLHYRGLTNTGFSILHHLGLSPSIRSLPAMFARVVEASKGEQTGGSIWWCDNLRRVLKGFFPSLEERQDWTVTGKSILPIPLPEYDPRHSAFGNVFTPDQIATCTHLISAAADLTVFEVNSRFDEADGYSVPLRSKERRKYLFQEADVLPSACGTILGTLFLLRYLVTNSLSLSTTYSICVLDYDLYWRVMKFYHTSSLYNPFKLQQQRLILIMGPWHIYKVLSEAVWKCFAAIVFAPMWIHVKRSKVPAMPSLTDITRIFIAVANTIKSQPRWEPNGDSVCSSICLLIYHYIPLVCLFYHIILL